MGKTLTHIDTSTSCTAQQHNDFPNGYYGNQNARKATDRVCDVLEMLYTRSNKPCCAEVHRIYTRFLKGEISLINQKTGEVYRPNDFPPLSARSVQNVLRAIFLNLVSTSKKTSHFFIEEKMPYALRMLPNYAFSLISLDDRDLPRKLKNTKQRPKAYYAYDVASQAIVGHAYSQYKNIDLVKDCFLSMFRLIAKKGWRCPAEVEVENHLMSQWKDSFLKSGVMFPHVRFCAPQNSQEKYAERLHSIKKYTIEHKNHAGVGRFYARKEEYKTESRKMFDEKNDTYEDDYYEWDELIADDERDIEEYNNSLHSNQKKYPGLTRWQVLEQNMNPNLKEVNRAILARYMGEHKRLCIHRGAYIHLSYSVYALQIEAVKRVRSREVDVYYLTNENGEPTDVFAFQDDCYISEIKRVQLFNRATIEQTEEDKANFEHQMGFLRHFRKVIKENEPDEISIEDNVLPSPLSREEVELPISNTPLSINYILSNPIDDI